MLFCLLQLNPQQQYNLIPEDTVQALSAIEESGSGRGFILLFIAGAVIWSSLDAVNYETNMQENNKRRSELERETIQSNKNNKTQHALSII